MNIEETFKVYTKGKKFLRGKKEHFMVHSKNGVLEWIEIDKVKHAIVGIGNKPEPEKAFRGGIPVGELLDGKKKKIFHFPMNQNKVTGFSLPTNPIIKIEKIN
ncbi:hypothetical protein HQ545_04775 [Candidatus Woesearchaeota archaeon]|nr:hypothetical protein [Candidatus Woesearchaeota archaeon]